MNWRPSNDTAVVVLSFNGKFYHQSFFPLLLSESSSGYDVVLINNASTDDTEDFVRQNFPEVNIISLATNKGFTGGYSLGLEQLTGYTYFVLLSADFEVSTNWFRPLYLLMENDSTIAACQPKIRFQKQKNLFEYAGAAGGLMDKNGYLFCRGRIFDTIEEDFGQYNSTSEVFWAGGGCFVTRAELFKQFGGLDFDFFAHMEEVDLCWRYKNAGYKIVACGNSTVFHVGGSVISYGSPEKLFYNFRNNLLLFLKNYHGYKFWLWLPKRLILDGISGIMYLFKGEFKNIFAIIRSHFSFYLLFRKFYKKRKKNKVLVFQPNLNGWTGNNILLDYFFRKKTKFSELKIVPKV